MAHLRLTGYRDATGALRDAYAQMMARPLPSVYLPAHGDAPGIIRAHSLDPALHTTARQPGIVVAVHPPTVRQVMETAARGIRMPRKSTSFSPKPRMGVVMRDLRDA